MYPHADEQQKSDPGGDKSIDKREDNSRVACEQAKGVVTMNSYMNMFSCLGKVSNMLMNKASTIFNLISHEDEKEDELDLNSVAKQIKTSKLKVELCSTSRFTAKSASSARPRT